MEPSRGNPDDQMEVSVTGSTGNASARTGTVAKSSHTRMVSSKYMQAASSAGGAPYSQRHDVNSRDAYQLRGGSVGPISATPAQPIHPGRSVNLTSTVRASQAMHTGRVVARESHVFGNSPAAGLSALSASGNLPFNISSAIETAAQEDMREKLLRFKQQKAQQRVSEKAGAPASVAMPPPSTMPAPRVPSLVLASLRDSAQLPAEGSRSARGTSGIYAGSSGGVAGAGAGAAPVSARGTRPQPAARAPGAPGGALTRPPSGAPGNAAKAPPVPRLSMVVPNCARGMDQQLRSAVNAPLPKDDAWDGSQGQAASDAPDEMAAQAVAKTPSSRITKSPRVTMPGAGTGAAPWPSAAAHSQHIPQPPPPSQHPHNHHQQQQLPQQQPAAVPPRSPPPLSARGAPAAHPGASAATTVAGSSTAVPTVSEANGGRVASNAEASTSDTGGRSIRDQIKMARLQELQWRCLKAKMDAAAKARIEKGQRQLAACSLLLTDMMAQSAATSAALATADALKHTRHVLAEQLPLLEQWRELQDTHGPATREVLTALQNAMTSLPLVNGAGLGMGGDSVQALLQLRRALANGLGSLQSAEVALGMLLQGVSARASSGGAADTRSQGQNNQGGVPAMAALLPKLHDLLVEEVAGLRQLLVNLNSLAGQMDEAAGLRARHAAALSAAASQQSAGQGRFWPNAPGGTCQGNPAAAAALAKGDTEGRDANTSTMLDAALAMLGLGVG